MKYRQREAIKALAFLAICALIIRYLVLYHPLQVVR